MTDALLFKVSKPKCQCLELKKNLYFNLILLLLLFHVLLKACNPTILVLNWSDSLLLSCLPLFESLIKLWLCFCFLSPICLSNAVSMTIKGQIWRQLFHSGSSLGWVCCDRLSSLGGSRERPWGTSSDEHDRTAIDYKFLTTSYPICSG